VCDDSGVTFLPPWLYALIERSVGPGRPVKTGSGPLSVGGPPPTRRSCLVSAFDFFPLGRLLSCSWIRSTSSVGFCIPRTGMGGPDDSRYVKFKTAT
jgi:hypothetical protein